MNSGNLWLRQGKYRDAEAIYRKLRQRYPNDTLLLNNLGEAYREQGKWDEAVEVLNLAVEANPRLVEARINLGRCLIQLTRVNEAKAIFVELIECYPDLPKPYHYLGKLQFYQRDMANSASNIEKSVQLDHGDCYARSTLGFAYLEMGRPQEAIACFQRVLQIDPTISDAHGCMLFTMSGDIAMDQSELFEEHKKWGTLHGNVEPLTSPTAPHKNNRSLDRALRIGYVSPDLRHHAVSAFFQPVLMAHDSSQVETFCYAELVVPDETTEQLKQLADYWRFTNGLSDEQVARQVMLDEIDILVDLAGHTAGNRLRAFAYRPAPIQVTWLGYPNTTGLKAINYRLTCETQNPVGETSFHTEQLVHMPNGSFCFSRPVGAPAVSDLPATKNGYVTFGSLHRPFKISETVQNLWAEVLRSRPNSRLLIYNTRFTEETTTQLYQAFADRGIADDRVEIQNQVTEGSYLQLYDQIDIALDVTPWAGGTTTMEALWMGVPVIAYYGDRRSARSTAVIMKNVGHEELIARSNEEYVALASQLAGELPRLFELRKHLRQQTESTIVNADRFTRELETSYRWMWNQWCEATE